MLKIRRALLSVSDKTGIVELARALRAAGAELVATGRTASTLADAGLPIVPVERISGTPEAFQGRMKTLSYPICSGILYRRGDPSDEADAKKLSVPAIDCVVVNFYPFEEASRKYDAAKPAERRKLIEEVDIGGPTLVRAAAKNSPDVLVICDPAQYASVIASLQKDGGVDERLAETCAARAWERVLVYDEAIAAVLGGAVGGVKKLKLRYGENPHQTGSLEMDADSPLAWDEPLTDTELSYNNILDLNAAYALANDLFELGPGATGVVVIKHNNPCGVALVPGKSAESQRRALELAWEGDPVSAFGGVLIFTDPLTRGAAEFLAERFVELIAAPGLDKKSSELALIRAKRKNLKALAVRRWGGVPDQTRASVAGGTLIQSSDRGLAEKLKSVTKVEWPESKTGLARFGIGIGRSLKSNSIVLVRERDGGAYQLVGAGQGQPNRIEALDKLAVPRAKGVLDKSGGAIGDCVMVSDAFFPFRDTVDSAAQAGIRWIVQPGGSIKDLESIAACDEKDVGMVFTGMRHFRH